ncbi:sensor histidine kinase [Streptomyces sp. NBC_01497]|uniref:sensor histidine kinase n=1 Tax=Streptomyces sp. NBC_01497 TaxID=2903885 RepID=UPI002E38063D|nr:sensor histidine kinase [Streptomyces sp. NBC_01497]
MTRARTPVPATSSRRTRPWPVVLVLAFLALAGGGFAMERVVGVGAVAAYGVAGAVLLGWLESFRRAQRDLTHDLIKLRGEITEREAEIARREAHWHGYVNGQAERVREEAAFTLDRRLPAALARAEVPPALHTRGGGEARGHGSTGAAAGDDGVAVWFDRMLGEISRSIDEREESQRLSLVELANRIQTSAHRIQAKATGIADRYPGDTDLLDTTMQVDHAATQQARHAQSLKVLCDEWPGQQWQDPLALVDVVRAASGRIMSYRRVEVTGDPDIGIAAIVVEPLIHLVAELLANATEYSPPRTAVPVAVRPVQRGAVIEVDDGGLGLDDHRLDEAREIVSGRKLLGVGDVGEIPQTGFAVIGRFARRHGFGVDLGPSPYGGIRAVVLVPLEMLEKLAPPGTTPRRSPRDQDAERVPGQGPSRGRHGGVSDADASPADERFIHNPLVPQPPARKPRTPEPPVPETPLPRRAVPEPPTREPAAAEPLVPEPRPRPTDAEPPGGMRRLPRRRSARGEGRQVPPEPTSMTPPGSPEEAGEWMSAFLDGSSRQPQEPPHPRPAGDDGTPPPTS